MKTGSLLHTNQWPKNLLLLVPAFFAGVEWNVALLMDLLLGVVSCCLLASAVYLVNDRMDRHSDKNHPVKQQRVIAAEQLSDNRIFGAAVILLVIAFGGFALLGAEVAMYAGVYVLVNALYNAWLKQVAVIDVLLMTSGYWIRLLIGGAIAGVPLTWWLVVMVSLIANMLLLFKRHSDVLLYRETGVVLRKTIPVYARLPLETILRVLAVLICTLYACYLVHVIVEEHRSPVVLLTIIPAITGFFRLFHLLKGQPHTDTLHLIFTDAGMWVLGLTWIGILLLTIYNLLP